MRLLLACLLAIPGVLLSAPAAHACSCAVAEPEDLIARADLVAEVSVRSTRAASPTGDDRRSTVAHELDVERAWKGTMQPRVTVRTAADEAMCGLRLVSGERYLLLATGDSQHWRTGLCSGTTPVGGPAAVNAVTREDVESALGSGGVPPSPSEVATAPEEDEGGDAAGPSTIAWAAGGAVGVLLLLGLVIGLRLRR